MGYSIRPLTKTEARRFVTDHHRHNEAPTEMQVSFAVGLYEDEDLIGVATAGQPVARALCDGLTLEINRTCVRDVHRNANSMLYGALCRAAQALGYHRVVTYTLHDESGASLKASGFVLTVDVGARSWADSSVARPRYDENLFGERRNAANAAKYRWDRTFVVRELASA